MTTQQTSAFHSALKVYVIRLKPRHDLKQSLQKFAREHEIKASVILTCVGSLTNYNLRFANPKNSNALSGHFEIVSLTGTLSDTSCHIHLSLSDKNGVTLGGHLMDGNTIYSTAEISIGILPDLVFDRILDTTYGFHELEISASQKEL
ncbi:MAG: PPC domain-containing DNA-binding protein [Cyclobacteriaceae bacterium]